MKKLNKDDKIVFISFYDGESFDFLVPGFRGANLDHLYDDEIVAVDDKDAKRFLNGA